MAKKAIPAKKSPEKFAEKPVEKIGEKTTSSPVRNSAIPKAATVAASAATAPKPITHEMISKRAYEISTSGTGGSETDNWFRAERELRGL